MKTVIKLQFAILALFIVGCASNKNINRLQQLHDYEGQYEYPNPSSLVLSASDYDTTLYAIIDDAQYPLKHIGKDSFQTSQKKPLVFLRDKRKRVVSYVSEGKAFKLITKKIDDRNWFPRRELYHAAQEYTYRIPVKRDDGLLVGDLKDAFATPDDIIKMVRETINGEYRDVHSILIWKEGKLVLEEYFYGYTADTPHQLRSASKSFIGSLVGIAVDQGKIKSENELLIPLFRKEYASIQNVDTLKNEITIKDFLTYRHGMDCNDENSASAGNELKMLESNDWVKFTLDLPMISKPGIKSSYCTGCAQTIGRMVELVTQTPLVEYADKNLFGPMGITNYKWRFKPDTSSITTFNQMYLLPRDILKLAILYHNKGKWEGKQIVSQEWIKKTFEKDDVEFGYLWRHKYYDVDGKRYHSYLATGNGGQKINIWPELNMITIFTGGNYNSYLYGKTTPPNEMIPKYILKAK